jgi:hypothetical protein
MVHLIDRREASIAQAVSLDLVDTDIFMDDLDRAIALEFLDASSVLACCLGDKKEYHFVRTLHIYLRQLIVSFYTVADRFA